MATKITGRRRPAGLIGIAVALLLLGCALFSGAALAATAPKITTQPVSQTVEEGQSVTFTAAASGSPTPSVQWEISIDGGTTWLVIEGATATQYTIASAKTSEDGYRFRAVFKNEAGKATSKAATLTVRVFPAITKQPQSTTVEEGQSAVFEATASGFPAPTVQWQSSSNGGATWSNISGATSTQLVLANVKTSSNGNQYRTVFKNNVGSVTSEAATLTVQKSPAITKQPASVTVREGQNATFEASASGFPAPTVQWELSIDGGATWTAIEGATSTALTIEGAVHAEDGRRFRAVFTNAAGSATSQQATLTVHDPPVVTQEPASATVQAGQLAAFQASASGFPTPTAQWERSTDGGKTWSAVPGATSEQLTIAEAQLSENGQQYRVTFTSAAGTATSDVATLTVATSRYSALAWGQNLFRQLGNGSFESLSDLPVPVSGLQYVTAVAAGGRHSLALLADGTVMAWGNNSSGQLGDGTTMPRSVPVPVSGLSGVKAIAAGADHSLALLNNGTVMAWGSNESGQLGTGNTADSEVPVAVKTLSSVKAISAGAAHSLALLTNGTVMAWGENESGQLGTGNTNSSNVPVAVKGGLSGVSAVSAGGEFSLALLTDGTVRGWGSNRSGQLANSSVEGVSELPVATGSLSGVTAVAAGAEHALALLGGGTVMAWGEDSYGEIGNGTVTPRQETPVQASGIAEAIAISAGGQDSIALLASGSVKTWGINEWGTLGDGAHGGPSTIPVEVAGVRKVASVSAGGFHMLAYGEPIPTVSSVTPKVGPAQGGNTVAIAGTDLTGATSVRFGATEAASFTVESSTSITATAPPGTGTVDVKVTTPAGASPAHAADRYTYQAQPTVTKLSPKAGPTTGGTAVTITGTEFTGASGVSFGGVTAASYTVKSATSITAVSPMLAAGTVDVTVTNISGTSALTTKDRFKFTPIIESLTPSSGPTAGGTSVTVTGTGFALGSATTFKFGRTKAASVSCTSSASCTVVSPAHEAGTVDVIATVSKVKSPTGAGDRFTYS
jgi:alpha-tubulin suppressor-like RCC1 family protein